MRRFGRVKGLCGPGEIRTHDRNGKTDCIVKCIQMLQPLGHAGLTCGSATVNLILFWTKNFRNFEITFPHSGCSRYLKACRRPTLWLLSFHFGRMQEHPLQGKDIKHQSSIYLIKIDKT